MEFSGKRHNVFDLTFGKLPQLVGYEFWLQRFLSGLAIQDRDEFRREVRLAKRLFSMMGDLYGTGTSGFRGNVVEQFIIQGRDYRCDGLEGGSLDNSLTLIAEELGSEFLALAFDEYKARFPLWHPGWWETGLGLDPRKEGVNILDLIGGGDVVMAERLWGRLKAIAIAHQRYRHSNTEWNLESVVSAARDLLTRS
jgi:hypothetical protein